MTKADEIEEEIDSLLFYLIFIPLVVSIFVGIIGTVVGAWSILETLQVIGFVALGLFILIIGVILSAIVAVLVTKCSRAIWNKIKAKHCGGKEK